jgi:hypothetical protein
MAIVSRKISGIWVLEFLCRKLTVGGHLDKVEEEDGEGIRRQLAALECADNGGIFGQMERNGGTRTQGEENIPLTTTKNSFSE